MARPGRALAAGPGAGAGRTGPRDRRGRWAGGTGVSLPLLPAATCSEPYEEQGLWPHLQGTPPPRGTSRGPRLDRTLAHTRPRAALPGPTRSAASCAVAPRIIFYLPGKGSLPRPLLCTPFHVPPVMCCVLRCERGVASARTAQGNLRFPREGVRRAQPPNPAHGRGWARDQGAAGQVVGRCALGAAAATPPSGRCPHLCPSAALGHITPTFQRPGKTWPWARPPLCDTVVTTGGGG